MKFEIKYQLITLPGIVFILLCLGSVHCQQCTQVSNAPPCVCSLGDKNIDLRSLAYDNTAAFKIDKASDNNGYSYNPCNPFTDGDCKDVAGCQNAGGKRSIGTQKSAKFSTDDKGVTSITYTGGNGGRSMIVALKCDEGAKIASFDFVGELSTNQYSFTLTSVCACPGGCTGKGGSNSNSSSDKAGIPGIIIISLFFVAVIVYFVAGMIIMRVKYQKTGTDIIPNKAFWTSIPYLVKDGVVFTFTPCIQYCKERKGGYSKF